MTDDGPEYHMVLCQPADCFICRAFQTPDTIPDEWQP